MNTCDKCECLKDVFGNYVQCVLTGRFVDYEYWNNLHPNDCPKKLVKTDDKEKQSDTIIVASSNTLNH